MRSGNNNNETPKSYLCRYEPAKHLGVSNWRGTEYTYWLETAASLEGEFFYAKDLDNGGALKRFTTHRINEIICVSE
tara:strand:+ start:136 stop:366 length:231 start_codon:yes stop_codon:yes gene_type:complete